MVLIVVILTTLLMLLGVLLLLSLLRLHLLLLLLLLLLVCVLRGLFLVAKLKCVLTAWLPLHYERLTSRQKRKAIAETRMLKGGVGPSCGANEVYA